LVQFSFVYDLLGNFAQIFERIHGKDVN